VTAVLAGPYLAAAGVLCVSGAAKLRAPGPAARAVGVPAVLVRIAAACELALGVWAALSPGLVNAVAVSCAYGAFAAVAVVLARRHAACGCFGESEAPASIAQAVLSVAIAACSAAAALSPPGGVGWVLARPPAQAVILAVGLGACVYGLVVAYTQLPAAWAAWEA